MRNSTFFPFERNKYFYGKLLSVDDFELEQKYVNDKRRMINRLAFGTGIVAGMYVVGVDERTISVETGCAIDAFGREVVIDLPVIKKLSLIDGFEGSADMENNYVYLCVEYDEKETGPVHNIVGNPNMASKSDNEAYNRVKEGYHLYLTNQDPEEINLSFESLYEECVTVYSGAEISIRQTLPRFVRVGQDVELKLEIENLNQQYVSFSYQLDLTCLTYEGESQMSVAFDEMLYEKSGKYSIIYHLKAASASDAEGIAAVNPDSFKLFIAKQQIEASADKKSVIRLTERDAKEEVLDGYYHSAMEDILRNGYKENLYLAKIYMIKIGDSYIIDNIKNVPFHQYVMGNSLNGALSRMMMKTLIQMQNSDDGKTDYPGQSIGQEGGGRTKTEIGSYTFRFPQGAQRGQRFFSKEIFHGLGLGRVSFQTGFQMEENETYFGSSEVFTDPQIKAEIAIKTDEAKGCFVIGIRILEAITGGALTVCWHAAQEIKEARKENSEKKIFIRPSILELEMRESYYLEGVCANMSDKRIEWIVKDNEGSISANGCYTAPNTAGVYEVTAQSMAFPEVRASIFVVVRDKKK